MEFWFFIAMICIAGCYFDYKKSTAKLQLDVNRIEDSTVVKELDNVKRRLAVLEKIITDKNYELNEEISSLRERP